MKHLLPAAIIAAFSASVFAQSTDQPTAAIGLKLAAVEKKFGERVDYAADLLFKNDTLFQFRTAKVYTNAIFNRDQICIEVTFSGKFTPADVQAILAGNGEGWKVLRKPSTMDRDYKDGVTYQDARGNFARAHDAGVTIRTPERMKNLETVGVAPR